MKREGFMDSRKRRIVFRNVLAVGGIVGGAALTGIASATAQVLPTNQTQLLNQIIASDPAFSGVEYGISHYEGFYGQPPPAGYFTAQIEAALPPTATIAADIQAALASPSTNQSLYQLVTSDPAFSGVERDISHYEGFYGTTPPAGYFAAEIEATLPPTATIAADIQTALASPQCFLRGTQIATPSGECRVEELAIGDPVITLGGVAYKIQWIGRRLCAPTKANLPVRFARGSLAPNLPHADLLVSQEHALLIHGLLIRAIELVNGISITIDPCESLTEIEYLHVKLANPDVLIFAEGVPSETLIFVNGFGLGGFDNADEYERLYGVPEIGKRGDVIAFYRGRDRLKSHLRGALSPWIDRRTAFDRVRDHLLERADLVA
jgi:hypothetical protein